MSLRPRSGAPPVPDVTARVARAAFPRGNPCLLLRQRLGAVFRDGDFADLYPALGQPAYAPWRLALVTLMQFREGVSDRQAAAAVRGRIDWKYLRCLELPDPGFRYSVLSECRDRLLAGAAASWGCCGRAGGSAPTRPTCWQPSAPSTGRNRSARRRATPPATCSPPARLTGCASRCRPRGASATAPG